MINAYNWFLKFLEPQNIKWLLLKLLDADIWEKTLNILKFQASISLYQLHQSVKSRCNLEDDLNHVFKKKWWSMEWWSRELRPPPGVKSCFLDPKRWPSVFVYYHSSTPTQIRTWEYGFAWCCQNIIGFLGWWP